MKPRFVVFAWVVSFVIAVPWVFAGNWESTGFTRKATDPYVAMNPATSLPQVTYSAQSGVSDIIYLFKLNSDGKWSAVSIHENGSVGEGHQPKLCITPKGESYLS